MATPGSYTVHIPLIGIEMRVDAAPFGDVVLKRMQDAQFDALAQQVVGALGQSPANPLLAQLPQLLETLRETVAAEVVVSAEPERAKREAEAVCRRVLDLLRYSIPTVYPDHMQLDIAIGIRGDILPLTRARLNLAIAADGDNLQWQDEAARTPYVLSADTIEHLATLGVFEVATILRRPERQWTDFESTLLDGIHWFGNAQMEFEVAYRLLSLITCLETFLTPQDGNPIGAAIAEGVAIVIGDTLEQRKQLKKEVHGLYQMRSAVTHGGRRDVPEDKVAALTTMAQQFIVGMIARRDQFNDRDDLLGWILDQKLSPAGKP